MKFWLASRCSAFGLRTMRLALVLAATLLAAAPARAQLADTDISNLLGNNGTIGTGAVEIVPMPSDNAAGFPPAWTTLFIANASATATIACSFSNAVTVNGPDSFTIPPQQSMTWYPGTTPRNRRIWCIASASSTPFMAKLGSP